MKICAYFDPHWSQNSSIIRSRGSAYSTRLENLIQSINWVELLAWDQGCKCIICGGDFFDSAILNSEEISALHHINWAPLSHVFITGNHEVAMSNLDYSSSHIFSLCPNSVVFNKPEHFSFDGEGTELCFLPYILERDRLPLSEYFPQKTSKRIIFSHNDIKDIQYGQFISTEGFSVSEIENNCDLFLNGHIHHCCQITDRIINGGNLTGQNFTEDGYSFEHCALIIDTDDLSVKFFKNPHAFNFYKINLLDCSDIDAVRLVIDGLKNNSIVTFKVRDVLADSLRSLISTEFKEKVIEYRIIVEYSDVTNSTLDNLAEIQSADHLKSFEAFVLSNIGDNEVVCDELMRILR